MPRTKSPRTLKAKNQNVGRAKKGIVRYFCLKDDHTLLLPAITEYIILTYKIEGHRLYFRPTGFDGVLLESDRKQSILKQVCSFYLNAWRNMNQLTPEQQERLKKMFREIPLDTSLVCVRL